MRYLPVVLACLPIPIWAADIPLQSDVRAVTVFPQGATITREVAFSAPAGQHQLILTDLPPDTPLERVRVALSGATLGSISARNDFLPPADPETISRQQALLDEIDRLEKAVQEHEATIRLVQTEVDAAQARVAFLRQLGTGDGVAALGADALRDLTRLVGDETLSALKSAHDATLRVASAGEARAETQDALERARQKLEALQPGTSEGRAMLSVAISAPAETTGTATITYTIDEAGWTPVYDLKLTRASGALSIARGAFLRQSSGENWQDVALTLSTARPSDQTAPSEVWPWPRRIYDPKELQPLAGARMEADMMAAEAPMLEPEAAPSPKTQAEAAFDGLSVSYTYPDPVSVANRADRVRITLGSLETSADLVAQAVPLSDPSAFLMASLDNATDEVILPTSEAMFYLDGRFVGQRALGLIPAGGKAELSFGPIDGLRLSREIVTRSEGDRGIISKSNAASEHVRITVENLTGEAWPLRLIDRVPYSEQDDLRITWQADPPVTEEDVNARRGVLAWSFDLPSGARQIVNLTHKMEWPAGKYLQ